MTEVINEAFRFGKTPVDLMIHQNYLSANQNKNKVHIISIKLGVMTVKSNCKLLL